jgi:hypothetical protein
MVRSVAISLFFAAVVGLGQNAAAPPAGSAQGIVLGGDGKPLAGASVCAVPHLDNLINASRRTETDEAGRFELKDVPAGDVDLRAYKETDGYPKAYYDFYVMPGEVMPEVHIDSGQTVTGVVIQLGARAARLSIQMIDENHIPLEGRGELILSRLDQPETAEPYKVILKTQDSLPVPPTPFRLMVKLDGYETWHSGGRNWRGLGGVISPKPGESMTLIVRLKRLP